MPHTKNTISINKSHSLVKLSSKFKCVDRFTTTKHKEFDIFSLRIFAWSKIVNFQVRYRSWLGFTKKNMARRPNQDGSLEAVSSSSNMNQLNKNIVMQLQANAKESGFVNQGFETDVKGESLNLPQQPPTSQKIMDFDDFLPYVGEFGRYQKILFLWMIPFSFFIAFVYFSQTFMIVVPEEHNCLIPDLQHLSRENR